MRSINADAQWSRQILIGRKVPMAVAAVATGSHPLSVSIGDDWVDLRIAAPRPA